MSRHVLLNEWCLTGVSVKQVVFQRFSRLYHSPSQSSLYAKILKLAVELVVELVFLLLVVMAIELVFSLSIELVTELAARLAVELVVEFVFSLSVELIIKLAVELVFRWHMLVQRDVAGIEGCRQYRGMSLVQRDVAGLEGGRWFRGRLLTRVGEPRDEPESIGRSRAGRIVSYSA